MRMVLHSAALTAVSLALAACGGGGGGGERPALAAPPAQSPSPSPTPTPTPTSLNIFESAPTGEFSVAGASFSSEYGDPEPMNPLSLAAEDQPRFRYDAATRTYEVMLPGRGWDTLITNDQTLPDWGRRMTLSGSSSGSFRLNYERSLNQPDSYPASTIGHYFDGDKQGWIAIGIATPAASLPTDGSATFNGLIRGSADVLADDGWGGVVPADITGTLTLVFNFGQSSLIGSMSPLLGGTSLGTFEFADTVYSAGQYSGRFSTTVGGVNSFSGTLTGPAAQESIGAWALPFHYSVDGKDHQAAGAWIAKR